MCVCVCVCVCVWVGGYVFSVYTYAYIHMRTCIHHSLIADCRSRKAIAFQKLEYLLRLSEVLSTYRRIPSWSH